MARKWYGNLTNRIEEDRQYTPEIKVGTGMTEYLWSDRHAYEVIAVKDQKHVTVREYDHKLKGDAFSNDWELISNPENRTKEMNKRGKYWYEVHSYADGTKHYERKHVSFGVADYYYDYEF